MSDVNVERRLVAIGVALDAFFDRCEDTVGHTDHSMLCWLRGHFTDQPYRFPFQLVGRNSTKRRYRNLWKRLTYLVVRVYCLDPIVCAGLLRLKLTAKQRASVARLWNDSWWERHPEGLPPSGPASSQGDSFPSDESDDEDSGTSDDDRQSDGSRSGMENSMVMNGGGEETVSATTARSNHDGGSRHPEASSESISPCRSSPIDELADLVGLLASFLCTEQYRDSRAASTLLVYYSGVLGISPDGMTFQRPRAYTSNLSGLVYCIRLVLLEATLPRFPHSYVDWVQRPSVGQLEKLNATRGRFMSAGCQAPMGELLSRRSYGRALSRTDGPSFRVRWSDDAQTIFWADGQLTMDGFRKLAHQALEKASRSCSSLMFNFQPSMALGHLRDNMSNYAAGHSFVLEPPNKLVDSYLKLLPYACADPPDGLMSDGEWDLTAVDRYLQKEGEFQRQLMLILYLLGGQAPRSTELFSLERANGPGSSRGIYLYGDSLIYVTRHHKARRATNREFQVACFLPPTAGELLFQYLVYIRPFADMLRRVCLHRPETSRLLFFTSGAENTPWTSGMLSKELRDHTAEAVGVAFGVQTYRQLSIAITERHIRDISGPFNRFDDHCNEIDMDAAFAWQSSHRPVQRGTAYGLDGAYPDSLQPALLRVYQWASTKWHRFLNLCGNSGGAAQPASPHVHSEQDVHKITASSNLDLKRRMDAMGDRPVDQNKRLCEGFRESSSFHDRAATSVSSEPRNLHHEGPFASHLAYLEEYKVVVCIPCGQCIDSKRVKRHLRACHPAWPHDFRKRCTQYVKSLSIAAPMDVKCPPPCEQPLQWLSIYNGWSCLRCEYLCTTQGLIQQHARKSHDRLGGQSQQWRPAKVQTFFPSVDSRYFEVCPGD